MSKQVDFRFQINSTSQYLPLISYLNRKNKTLEFPRQQMIMWAIAAFWYPVACKWIGGFSDAELKNKARNAIYQLTNQIAYLSNIFDLENYTPITPSTRVNSKIDPTKFEIEDNKADILLNKNYSEEDSLLDNSFI